MLGFTLDILWKRFGAPNISASKLPESIYNETQVERVRKTERRNICNISTDIS